MSDTSYDPLNWMREYLKIVTKGSDMVPLVANEAQLKVHNTLLYQRDSGNPQRALVLKARQEGVSTYSEARLFYEINTRQRRTACVVSADIDSTHKVFSMSKIFQDNMQGSC